MLIGILIGYLIRSGKVAAVKNFFSNRALVKASVIK